VLRYFSNDTGAGENRSETNLPTKKTCLTSDAMDTEDFSDNDIDAEEQLESMQFLLLLY